MGELKKFSDGAEILCHLLGPDPAQDRRWQTCGARPQQITLLQVLGNRIYSSKE